MLGSTLGFESEIRSVSLHMEMHMGHRFRVAGESESEKSELGETQESSCLGIDISMTKLPTSRSN